MSNSTRTKMSPWYIAISMITLLFSLLANYTIYQSITAKYPELAASIYSELAMGFLFIVLAVANVVAAIIHYGYSHWWTTKA